VAVFIYRRPSLVRQLFATLRVYQPARLWLVADGPKSSEEKNMCSQARQEAEGAVDWPCEVRRVYANSNLGLKRRLESGLDEVFSRESEAMILEEDCHPTPDYFPFCAEMLARYRDEPKVAGISGNCFLPQKAEIKTDYFFSRYLHIWGWATWARAWNSYDRKNWAWPAGGFRELFPDAERREEKYWNRIFSRMATGRLSTWDYGFISWIWMNGQVAITPAQNLVRNAGFGPDATNTRDESAETGIEREGRLQPPFRGPADIRADGEVDRLVFQNHLLRQEGRLSFWPRIRRSILKRISA